MPGAGRPATAEVGVIGVLVADHAVAEVPLPPAVFALGQSSDVCDAEGVAAFWRFIHLVHLVKSSAGVSDRWRIGGEELAGSPYGPTRERRGRVLFVMSGQ